MWQTSTQTASQPLRHGILHAQLFTRHGKEIIAIIQMHRHPTFTKWRRKWGRASMRDNRQPAGMSHKYRHRTRSYTLLLRYSGSTGRGCTQRALTNIQARLCSDRHNRCARSLGDSIIAPLCRYEIASAYTTLSPRHYPRSMSIYIIQQSYTRTCNVTQVHRDRTQSVTHTAHRRATS